MKKLVFSLLIFGCALMHSQNVDLFTGNYSQGFPLIHIPSNKGNGVDLTALYNSGIRVKQSSSDIGLGWELSGAGEITRSMVGFPDDIFNYVSYMPRDIDPTNPLSIIHGQGALYPDNRSNGTTNYDIGFTNKGLDSTEFAFPDYDNFNVSGPGMHGNMSLKYLRSYNWSLETYAQPIYPNNLIPYFPPFNMTPVNIPAPYRKPQFYFKGTFYDTLISRYYPNAGITQSTPYVDPTSSMVDAAYPSGSYESYLGKHLNGSSVTDENYDPTTGRLATENHVEYFRNGEIDSAGGSFSGALTGFMDYSTSHGRPANQFPIEGIGYFRVTNTQGYTYHYSLPVYQRQNTRYAIPLNYDHSVPSSINISDFASGINPLLYPGNNLIVIRSDDNNTFALKWLLTSITGPDFVDANNNNFPDDGDEGNWVRYDYVKWSDSFTQRTPYYGYENSFNPDPSTEHLPNYLPVISANPLQPGLSYKISGNYASANVSVTDIYYLNKIRTPSHTGVLVRDVRKDEKGGYTGVTVPQSAPAPLLYVKRILLFTNSDFDNQFSTYNNPFNTANYTSYNFGASINNAGTIFNENWYQGHSSWDSYILNHVEFDQDYSLCKNYHGNIHVSCSTANVLTKPLTVQSNLSVSNSANSGKLTLKRILNYDYQNIKLAPSTKFTYGNNVIGYNPDYNPIKEDYWGFYKSDATQNGYSRYTSPTSQALTKAWSLTNIESPLGGKQEIVYESNTYNRVLDDESLTGIRGAAFIYRIKEAASVNANYSITMEEGSTAADELTEFVSFCNSPVPGMKKRICLPSITNTIGPLSSCINCGFDRKGFMFGNCSVNLNTSGGTSHKVSGLITSTCTSNVNCQNPIYVHLSLDGRYNPSYSPFGYFTSVTSFGTLPNDTNGVTYTGNGFLMFEMPVGTTVYGNGIRVSQIKTTNESGEEYVKKYEYEDGTAVNEMDRFEYPRMRRGYNEDSFHDPAPLKYTYLESKNFGPFVNAYSIGYSKVTEKDMGRVNVANGKTETYFITDPTYKANAFFGNKVINSVVSTVSNGNFFTAYHTINECVNKFSNVFGAVREQRVYDKNNTILSKTVNEYELSSQGAMVEVFKFSNPHWFSSYPQYFDFLYQNNFVNSQTESYMGCISHTVNILRDFPVRLKSITTYMMNTSAKTEILKIDELTGVPLCTRNTDMNGNTSLSYSYPAYKYYQPLEGLTFTTAAFRKLLPLRDVFHSYSNSDSTFTPLSGGRSTTFSGANYNTYSKYIKKRTFQSGTYVNVNCTLQNYMNNRSFLFNAGKGSLNDYGLYNKSDLYLNQLNFTPTYYWEPGSTSYNWKLLSEVTLIDKFNHIVETRDMNDRFGAIRFGQNGYHKNASVSNCNYSSFTFAGFESNAATTGSADFEGEMIVNNHALINTQSHTGQKCVRVTNGNPVKFYANTNVSPGGSFETGLMSGRIYRASVWVYDPDKTQAQISIVLNGFIGSTPYAPPAYIANSTNNLATTINNWSLLQMDFTVPEGFTSGNLAIELRSTGSNVHYDDFILHPVESDFSAFVHDLRTGWLTATIDGNGIATKFIYDASGKMTEEWKEVPSVGYKKTKKMTYNFGRGAND